MLLKLRNKLVEYKNRLVAWGNKEAPYSIEQLLLRKQIIMFNKKVEEHKIRGVRLGQPLLRKVCRKEGNSPHINFPATPDVLSLISTRQGEDEFVELHIFQTGEREATAIITRPKENQT